MSTTEHVELHRIVESGIIHSPEMGIRVHPYRTTEQCIAMEDRIANAINRDYAGQQVLLVQFMHGASVPAADLLRKLDPSISARLAAVQFSSYEEGTQSAGKIEAIQGWMPILYKMAGVHVIKIEDIVDTGITLYDSGIELDTLVTQLPQGFRPLSIRTAALLSKPSRRLRNVEIHYLGEEIADDFVVGWGLDLLEEFRNLPYIGRVEIYDQQKLEEFGRRLKEKKRLMNSFIKQMGIIG